MSKVNKVQFKAFIPALGITLKKIAIYNDMIEISKDRFLRALPKGFTFKDGGVYNTKDNRVLGTLCGDSKDWMFLLNGQYRLLQYTTLRDAAKKKIYCEDTVRFRGSDGEWIYGRVHFERGCFVVREDFDYERYGDEPPCLYEWLRDDCFKVKKKKKK